MDGEYRVTSSILEQFRRRYIPETHGLSDLNAVATDWRQLRASRLEPFAKDVSKSDLNPLYYTEWLAPLQGLTPLERAAVDARAHAALVLGHRFQEAGVSFTPSELMAIGAQLPLVVENPEVGDDFLDFDYAAAEEALRQLQEGVQS